MFKNDIWKRTGVDELSRSAYVRAIAVFTIISGLLVATGGLISYRWDFSVELLIITTIVAVGSMFVFTGSSKPMTSFIGVSMMSFALGLMIGPYVALHEIEVVIQAVVITVAIMVVMSLLGILMPHVFEGWGTYLMAGLTFLIVAQFAQIIFIMIGFEQAAEMPLLAWAGVGLFTAFVAYDWTRALKIPFTLDNAIDASGGLVLDAVNIFIRILQISGGKGSSRR